jgi:hypothetical protein
MAVLVIPNIVIEAASFTGGAIRTTNSNKRNPKAWEKEREPSSGPRP